MFDRFKRLLGKPKPESPPLAWLNPDETAFGVPVLDLRPHALGTMAFSTNREAAENAISFGGDDGLGFVGQLPKHNRQTQLDLQYPIDGRLFDGVLFVPQVMEHKWAIFFHCGRIIFVRSWLREVTAIAETEQRDGLLRLTSLLGDITGIDATAEFVQRFVDFLLRSHVLNLMQPAPLTDDMAADPKNAASYCFSWFGRMALEATHHPFTAERPVRPMRTSSLFHIAIARSDLEAASALLREGVPIGLLGNDGLTAMHWALVTADNNAMAFLLEHGAHVDARSEEAATPLMNAIQSNDIVKATFLLDHGANLNAADVRGFTSLHRAAERGLADLARLLLERGADPSVMAEGHTPRSFAADRGHLEIVSLLESFSA